MPPNANGLNSPKFKRTVDILLINLPWVSRRKQNVWRSVASVMPALSLAWLAALLEQHGHKVQILDACAQSMSVDAVGRWLESQGPCRMVGLNATTPLIGNASRLADIVKTQTTSAKIVLGGVQPTVLPEEVLTESDDYDLSVPVTERPSVSSATVVKCYSKAHRKFYLRLGFILDHLRTIRGLEDLVSTFRGIRARRQVTVIV